MKYRVENVNEEDEVYETRLADPGEAMGLAIEEATLTLARYPNDSIRVTWLADDAVRECKHCGRTVISERGVWTDPQATGDDAVWRETCDAHDTFMAEHEPAD